MASPDSNKFYPAASEPMARLLGLTGQASIDVPTNTETEPEVAAESVALESISATVSVPTLDLPELVTKASESSFAKTVGKVSLAVLPYLVVFAVGVLVYYGFFADPSNRIQWFNPSQKEQPSQALQKQEAMAAIQKQEASAYAAWISQFYFNVSDASIIAMDYVGQNKLTNFENYLLKLNPKLNDVRGKGSFDADLVLQGIDPVSGAGLADWQRDAVAQYFDVDAIRARLGVSTTAGREVITPRVAQAVTPTSVSTPLPDTAGTNCAENRLGINTAIPGRLEVATMGVNVPIIWTKSEKDFDTDLKTGVVHYPCTPLPGDVGTAYISGHSSNYAWIQADFNRVFARINELADGATFVVTVVGQDGKDIRLHYVVQRKQIYEVNDQAQFTNTADSLVALSTCWPINTNKQRMVAFGKLDRVER